MVLIEPQDMANYFAENDGNAMTPKQRIIELIRLNIPITIKFENKSDMRIFADAVMDE